MVDYEKLYKILFNGITNAIWSMEKRDYEFAQENLILIQQNAEELYIQSEE